MTDPSEISLNVDNDGRAAFVVKYGKADDASHRTFPFVSTPVQKLSFVPTADDGTEFRSAAYDDPMIGGATGTTAARMIGSRVTVHYVASDEAVHQLSVTGKLIQLDDTAAVVSEGATTVSIKTDLLVSVVAETNGAAPLLITDVTSNGPLAVSGTDSQFSYDVHHSVVLEPVTGSDKAGTAVSTLRSFVTIMNRYRYPVRVNSLTVTENEHVKDMYQAEAAPAVMTFRAAPAQKKMPVARSEQKGAHTLDFPVNLTANARTVVALGTVKLGESRWHMLGEIDPTDDSDSIVPCKKPLDLVVRLWRKNAGFTFSGSASVCIDMDPLPGVDHVLTSENGGFWYDAWDSANAVRMYYNMGVNTLVMAEQQGFPDDAKHNERDNTHRVFVHLSYTNKTPYFVVVKQTLRGQRRRVIKNVKAVPRTTGIMHVNVGDFVREVEEDIIDQQARTLTLTLAPSTEGVVTVTTNYYLV